MSGSCGSGRDDGGAYCGQWDKDPLHKIKSSKMHSTWNRSVCANSEHVRIRTAHNVNATRKIGFSPAPLESIWQARDVTAKKKSKKVG